MGVVRRSGAKSARTQHVVCRVRVGITGFRIAGNRGSEFGNDNKFMRDWTLGFVFLSALPRFRCPEILR